MGRLVLLLFGLLQLHRMVASQSGCKNLKLYDGTNEVSSFACNGHGNNSTACSAGPSSFPGNLSVGDPVGKPRDFEADGYLGNFTYGGHLLRIAGLAYSWKPPLDTASRRLSKGFYLKMQVVGTAQVICRLFDLQSFDLTTSTQFRFAYDMFPFNIQTQTTYFIELFSLPPPQSMEYEEGLVEQRVITLPAYHNYSKDPVKYPNSWKTWATVKMHNAEGIVEVSFGFPDENSNAEFTKFAVQLVRTGASEAMMREEVQRVGSATVGKYNFTNVPSGSYIVQVIPLDSYQNDNVNCQCWHVRTGFRFCGTCSFSQTASFSFTSPVSTSPATTTTTTTSSTTSTTAPSRPGQSNPVTSPLQSSPISSTVLPSLNTTPSSATPAGVIVAAVIGAVAVVLIAVAVLCVLKRKGFFTGKDDEPRKLDFPPYPFEQADLNGNEKGLLMPALSRKTVLLLASEDHDHFCQAVGTFAEFLRLHCQCDVLFAPQQTAELRKTGNSYCWLSRQIDSADFVIIVTSEAALRLYLAYRKGFAYKEVDFGPEGDLFTPGIQHICGKIANNEDVRNVMMVYFDHTSPSYRLPIAPLPSCHYHLPSHLPSFLHHLHGLDKNKMDLSQVNLPLSGNIEELTGGKEWLTAVQSCTNYEKQNKGWFDKRFGKPTELFISPLGKPGYAKQVSGDSGYSGERNSCELPRRLSSVSMRPANPGVENEGFTKDDFTAPSIFTVETAYTVPYSSYMESQERPVEIDAGSTISEEFRRFNNQYEQDRFEEQQQVQGVAVTEPVSTVGNQTYVPQNDQFLYLNIGGVHFEGPYQNIGGVHFEGPDQLDGDLDCISVTSAQSV